MKKKKTINKFDASVQTKISDHRVKSQKQLKGKQITVIKNVLGNILCSSSMTFRLKYNIKHHK